MISYSAQTFDDIKQFASIFDESIKGIVPTQVASSFLFKNAGRVWLS